MAAKVSETSPGTIQALISSDKTRNMKNYILRGLDFEPALNGVTATLRYRMKPEVEVKLSKQNKGNGLDYQSRYCEDKLVFEGFDTGELSELLTDAMKQIRASKGAASPDSADDED